MRKPIDHPLPLVGSVLVHKADGSTMLMSVLSECWESFELNAVRALFSLEPLDPDKRYQPSRIGNLQHETDRKSVVIRSMPGFLHCGFEGVEIESKDERIVRLEQYVEALENWKRLATPIVKQDCEAAWLVRDGEVIDTMEALRVQIQRGSCGEVVSPNGCEVVR